MMKNGEYTTSLLFVALIFVAALCAACDSDGDRASDDVPAAEDTTMIPRAQFVGMQTCAECHHDMVNDYRHTSHFLSSALADSIHVKGHFDEGRNEFPAGEKRKFVMERAHDGRYFQTLKVKQRDYWLNQESHSFGIVIGSGKKGQTYLYWDGPALFQLPISYNVAADDWIKSPGYTDQNLNFNRQVGPRCIECHGSYIEQVENKYQMNNFFNRDNVELGITCERCHGPGAEHVAFHRLNPGKTEGQHIVNPSSLHIDRSLDICALCHAGHHSRIKPYFTYQAGDVLDSTHKVEPFDPDAELDVHGNQVGLFKQSQCFQQSDNMTCAACHDMHRDEVGQTKLFSQRCMSCHSQEVCNMAPTMGAAIADNCIDCHMPNRKSQVLLMQVGKDLEPLVVRSHLIKVYPEESAAFLKAHGHTVNE